MRSCVCVTHMRCAGYALVPCAPRRLLIIGGGAGANVPGGHTHTQPHISGAANRRRSPNRKCCKLQRARFFTLHPCERARAPISEVLNLGGGPQRPQRAFEPLGTDFAPGQYNNRTHQSCIVWCEITARSRTGRALSRALTVSDIGAGECVRALATRTSAGADTLTHMCVAVPQRTRVRVRAPGQSAWTPNGRRRRRRRRFRRAFVQRRLQLRLRSTHRCAGHKSECGG